MAPKGQSTRPTADRARQAIFNVVEHAHWGRTLEGARIIDAFAGSGALGLEALSRGAEFCLFIEPDAVARAAVTANIGALGCAGQSRVLARDARRLGGRGASDAEAYSVAFLDPPYREGLATPALEALAAGGWLAARALAIVEQAAEEAPFAASGFEALDERRWGAARVTFLVRG